MLGQPGTNKIIRSLHQRASIAIIIIILFLLVFVFYGLALFFLNRNGV